jgi:hypothetical protein
MEMLRRSTIGARVKFSARPSVPVREWLVRSLLKDQVKLNSDPSFAWHGNIIKDGKLRIQWNASSAMRRDSPAPIY